MANYRAGDVIRLTRKAIGMTQEQLSEEICSVETLSRIENNRQGIGKDVYECLMAKMERNSLRNYAICSSVDMKIAEEKQALEDAVAKVDYEKAKGHLKAMQQMMSATNYNQQYLARFEALIAYHTKEIDEQELIKRLDQVIRITLPKYEKHLESEKAFPFTEQEILSMLNLANAYIKANRRDKSVEIFKRLVNCLDIGYMDTKTRQYLKIAINTNLVIVLGDLEKYGESLEKAYITLNDAIEFGYGHVFSNLLLSVAWNNAMLGKKHEQELYEIKKNLRRAYYIAAARNEIANMNIIKKFYMDFFQEELCIK